MDARHTQRREARLAGIHAFSFVNEGPKDMDARHTEVGRA